MMTITIEIPALDRLCAILEQRDRGNILGELQTEITRQLAEAAKDGSLEKAAKAAPEKAPETVKTTETSSVTADAVPPSPTGEGKGVTLADVQQACAALRDAGKMAEVKGLFPEFGIKKLSDLTTPEQLAAFAGKLRSMGATI